MQRPPIRRTNRLFDAGDVVVAEFPGVTGSKRRPAAVLSSSAYHSARPDVILGLITSKVAAALGPTDYELADWQAVNLRVPSAFRAFISTVPRSSVSATIGRLSENDWAEVKKRVALALIELP